MTGITLNLDEDLVEALRLLDQPVEHAARELIVMELYRRALISSGRAAELLEMPKLEFIQYSGRLGIPFFRISEEEWQAEVERTATRSR